jgi:predicted transcriptional regulator
MAEPLGVVSLDVGGRVRRAEVLRPRRVFLDRGACWVIEVPASRPLPPVGTVLVAVRRGHLPAPEGWGMLAYMRRTTVKLPDDLDARLRHEAQRRGTTISEITREAIERHLGGPGRRLGAAAAGRSGRVDISEQIEEILSGEVGR